MRAIMVAVLDRLGGSTAATAWVRLELWQRRAIKTIVAIGGLVLATTVAYQLVMQGFEGRSPSFGHAAQVVIETYTGTGYGSDSPWTHPVANAFVALMDLSTFLLLFIVVPYVFRPVLEEALSPTAPTAMAAEDHVVVCGRSPESERLVEELDARAVEYVVLVEAEEEVLALRAAGIEAVCGDPTSTSSLERVSVDAADAVVVDTDRRLAASVVLAVRELNDTAKVVALVDDLDRERHLRYAGADRVLTPRHLLGRRIAERIRTELSPARSDTTALTEDLSILELAVPAESPLDGRTVAGLETEVGSNVSVLGLWSDGGFEDAPSPERVILADDALLVAGSAADLRRLERMVARPSEGRPVVVVAGYGIVGSTVVDGLADAAVECRIIDIDESAGGADADSGLDHDRVDGDGDASAGGSDGWPIDVVGDATTAATLETAGIGEAAAFAVAIGDDDESILSVLVADGLTEELTIVVRVNDTANETKVRRAGADYVLSLSEISGRILAREVLHEDVLSYNRQLKAVRLDAGPFAGLTIGESPIGEEECIVVGVERSGELHTGVDESFELEDRDGLLVVGSDEAIDGIER